MKDETLLRLSFAAALIGIFGLFVYSNSLEISSLAIYQLSDAEGRLVRTSGTIVSAFTSERGHTFLQVSDGTGQIKVVIFAGSGINTSWIRKGEMVLVEGRVSEYKGELEIIAKNVTRAS